ncbi:MAG: carboxypeptidase-like regulatory domain-containing protein [Planctomycetaceae bacterium]|jgi:hypothetical protein|nr:carboxypeptidase-like regulatory domain-containing protein [Planctomycetaceae bacterium]
MKHFSLFAILCSLFIFLSGCAKQDKPEGLPELLPYELILTQDGKPLPGANVSLTAQPPGQWIVGGGTDDNGVAKIYTHGKFAGAPAGKYKVVITKTVTEGGPTEADKNNPSYNGGSGKIFSLVDKQFGDVKTTPLEVDVKAGENKATLDAGKAVKIAMPQM